MNGHNEFVAVLSRTEPWHAVTEPVPSPEEIVMKTPFHMNTMASGLENHTEMTAGNPKHSTVWTATLHFISNVSSACTAMLSN